MRVSLVITVVSSTVLLLAVIVVTLVVTLSSDTGGPKDYVSKILQQVNTDNIDTFLRNLTSSPHPAGSDRDAKIATYIEETWKGMLNQKPGAADSMLVRRWEYEVFLASADPGKPNQVATVEVNGTISWAADSSQPPPNNTGDQPILSFNAYSAIGTAKSNCVVYIHYGRMEDHKVLEEMGISLSGCIALARYGALFRGDIVKFAEERGAKGVLLYNDPTDVAPSDTNGTYPDTIWAPPHAVSLGSLRIQGDLGTPGYPAKGWAYRLSESDMDLPTIPVQPLSYTDAAYILGLLGGERAPPDWQGDLPLDYHLGPALTRDVQVRIQVNNIHETKTIVNVMAMLRGREEPDRYVVVGNHYDAWTYGGVDPSSGTATFLEVTRVMVDLYHQGWRPRRTVLFCAWAAEEHGLIGSTEFAEELSTILKDRATAYINVDLITFGIGSFSADAVPHMRDAIYSVTQLVPNPDQEEIDAGNKYVYDTWLTNRPDTSGENPKVVGLGIGTDYRAYFFSLGIPSMDMGFVESEELEDTAQKVSTSYPLYHTAYDTYHLIADLMDPGLLCHQAIGRIWALLMYRFATESLLPLRIQDFGEFLVEEWDIFWVEHGIRLNLLKVDTDALKEAVQKLYDATVTFQGALEDVDLNDALEVRRYNDAMQLMDKSLLSSEELPERSLDRHVVFAPNWRDGYIWESFPGLRDLLEKHDDPSTPDLQQRLQQQVSVLVHHLHMAASALIFTPW